MYPDATNLGRQIGLEAAKKFPLRVRLSSQLLRKRFFSAKPRWARVAAGAYSTDLNTKFQSGAAFIVRRGV